MLESLDSLRRSVSRGIGDELDFVRVVQEEKIYLSIIIREISTAIMVYALIFVEKPRLASVERAVNLCLNDPNNTPQGARNSLVVLT